MKFFRISIFSCVKLRTDIFASRRISYSWRFQHKISELYKSQNKSRNIQLSSSTVIEQMRGEWTFSIHRMLLTWHVISEEQLSLVPMQIVMEITFIYLWSRKERKDNRLVIVVSVIAWLEAIMHDSNQFSVSIHILSFESFWFRAMIDDKLKFQLQFNAFGKCWMELLNHPQIQWRMSSDSWQLLTVEVD